MTERLLLLAPTARDAALSRDILGRAGLTPLVCRELNELCREIEQGAGAVLLTDAALIDVAPLAAALHDQPPWSDIPVILLSPLGPDSPVAVWAMNTLSNVTVLDQPVRIMTLVSALRTAVKARLRQYELRDQLEALRQSDRHKDEFLATLSHELRNPLAPIRNALHVLRLAGDEAQTRARVIETMERQVNNVVRLVDDLLELSRINEGRIALRKERVLLGSVFHSAIESSAPLIENRGLELIVEAPPPTLLLHADPVRLTQVFANLLNNAAKYTERGGSVRISARAEDGVAVVVVRDTGIGIPRDMLDRIFEMFVQVDHARERVGEGAGGGGGGGGGGLGIGLTLVKRLVEQHGGTVEARSAGVGQGSEFIVRLPAIPDQRTSNRAAAAAERSGDIERRKSARRPQRILVVDDHRDAGDSLGTLLRLLGHEVRVAYDSNAALQLARTFQPNVAVVDIAMPGMDGVELGTRFRHDPVLKNILLIALTGYGRPEDRNRTSRAGFDAHLVKPVAIEELSALLSVTAG
jgi:signal transduction histidine kinase